MAKSRTEYTLAYCAKCRETLQYLNQYHRRIALVKCPKCDKYAPAGGKSNYPLRGTVEATEIVVEVSNRASH